MQKAVRTDTRSLAAAIRRKCRECSGGSKTEAERCQIKDCALYPYRKPLAQEQVKIGQEDA